MLEILLFASWFAFGAYNLWLIGKARQYAPLSAQDVYILWSVHRKETHCNSSTYACKIHKKKGIIGFKCQCGHEYTSKRPIV